MLYVTMVLVLGTMTKVWQQLENNWVNQIVDWINNRSRSYQKRYCQWLIAQHNQLDIRRIEYLWYASTNVRASLYRPESCRKTPISQISPAMFKASEASSASQHPIPYYIEQGHLVLLGLPGSGKTTLLKNLGPTLINRKKQRKALKIQYKLPFFLSLRDYGNIIKEQEQFPLIDAVQAPLRKWNRSTPPGWVENCLNKGGCLVLLDGLDEVPDEETRLEMANWVQQQMVTYGLNNRFILTSRPYGYQNNPLNGVIVLEVQGFTYRQIREFVHNWYSAEEANRSKYALETFDNTRTGALRLTRILEHYLSHITRRRPFGKKGHSLTRLYIRYFARKLALHFSYWTWKELLSDAEQSSQSVESIVQRTIDTYFDISVAFAILEGRTEGKLSASEGILIVKERLEENQGKDE